MKARLVCAVVSLFAIAVCGFDSERRTPNAAPVCCNSCHLPTGETFMPPPVILREIIRIEKQAPKATVDAGGHVDGTLAATWIEHCTRRAEVKALGVREVPSPDGQQMKAQTVFRVKLRWDEIAACTKPKMRVCWLSAAGGPRTLNIQGCFDPDGDRRSLFVDCLAPTA